MARIFKICTAEEWNQACQQGTYLGSADDTRDGFIHFSTAEQLKETLFRHFSNRPGLIVVAFDSEHLGHALKWEAARNGQLFPHLYGPLDPATALQCQRIEMASDGTHILPSEFT